MRIRYNIANNRKVDYLKFSLTALIILMISALLVFVGAVNWSTTGMRFKNEKALLRASKARSEQKEKQKKNYENNIKQIRRQWNKRIRFANNLIDRKSFPFLERLDQLEELLPGGVFITKINLGVGAGSTVKLNIAAVSAKKLIEAFNAFLDNDIAIQKEEEKEGLHRASLVIKLQDKKLKKKNENK
jgi:Tfp pilus assembly protein PilN